MQYVKEERFKSVGGGDYSLATPQADGSRALIEKAMVGQVLHFLLTTWQPRAGQVLMTGELRTLNKVIDILEAKPQEEGHYRFEDGAFALLKRVVDWQAPLVMVRNAPVLEDYLTAAVDKLPKQKVPPEQQEAAPPPDAKPKRRHRRA